jgi:hypothetical protein
MSVNTNPPRSNITKIKAGQSPQPTDPKQVVAGFIIIAIILGLIIWGISTTLGSKQSNGSPTASDQTTAQKVKAWSTQYNSSLDKIGSDFTQVSTAIKNLDYPTITTACQQAGADIDAFQALPAIPDPTAATHLAIALTSLKSASQDCVNGVAQQDAKLIYRANDEITQGNTELNIVATDIKNLN